MATMLDDAQKVIDAVSNDQWCFNEYLRRSRQAYTKRWEDSAWWADGAMNLVEAIPMLSPAGPVGAKPNILQFSGRIDNNMQGYTLYSLPEHTIIRRHGQDLKRRYDLVNSKQDRVDLLFALVEVWKRREESKLRQLRKRKARLAKKQPQTGQGDEQEIKAASVLLHRHTHRRLTRASQKAHKPSPLCEMSVNTSPSPRKASATRCDSTQKGSSLSRAQAIDSAD